jgi:hypothetical protein
MRDRKAHREGIDITHSGYLPGRTRRGEVGIGFLKQYGMDLFLMNEL